MSYFCEKCGKEFKTLRARCGHQAHCMAEKEMCPICHQMFSKSNLQQHIEFCKKENFCLYCGNKISANKKFCNQSCAAKYNNHLRRKPVICLNCGKEFERRGKQKFCSQKCAGLYRTKMRLESFSFDNFSENKTIGIRVVRNYLMKNKEYKCAICGQLPEWNGKPLVLVVDHINGDSSDNRLENLRFVCPNCDMQLPTFGSKNRGHGRDYRRTRYKEGKSY